MFCQSASVARRPVRTGRKTQFPSHGAARVTPNPSMSNGKTMQASVSLTDAVAEPEVIAIYAANGWSAAEKPKQLLSGLRNSHSLATARVAGRLVGLGNAISDGHLVVYFPHLIVHPDFQRRGIGRALVEGLLQRYSEFHQLMLTADGAAIQFYEALGFERAGKTVPMWIYAGADH